MPARDGTGPIGQGPGSGRRFGLCNSNNNTPGNYRGRGYGAGRSTQRRFGGGGFGRRFGMDQDMGQRMGSGREFAFSSPRQPVDDEKIELSDYVMDLEAELDQVKQALNELNQKSKKEEKDDK